ncbi:MAG: pyridoxal phosphate-dependent aminotransferase [bacterium]
MLHMPISTIKKIEDIAGNNPDYVSLSQGSVKLGGVPEEIREYVRQQLLTNKTDYYQSCWGLELYREKVSQVLTQKYGQEFKVSQILPTHGCQGGITLLFMTLLDADSEIIIPEPAYPAYTNIARVSRGNIVYVSCSQDTSTLNMVNWDLDIEKIKQATTSKTKVILFSNPSNPMGIVIGKQKLLELVSWCEKHGIYLIVDEAYREYVFDGDCYSSLELVNKSKFVVSVHTFSKSMAMIGWRVGYIVAHEKLITMLAGMQDALMNCLNNASQYAALYALDHPEFTQKFFQIIKNNRDLAMHELQPLVDRGILAFKKPNGGIFLFLKTNQTDTADLCMDILNKAKVGLIPGRAFGPSGAASIRLCYSRETDVLYEGISRILGYFAQK